MPEAKKRYMRQDLQDWTDYAGVDFYWNDTFPLRTVLPLRIAIASGCNPLLIGAMCEQGCGKWEGKEEWLVLPCSCCSLEGQQGHWSRGGEHVFTGYSGQYHHTSGMLGCVRGDSRCGAGC